MAGPGHSALLILAAALGLASDAGANQLQFALLAVVPQMCTVTSVRTLAPATLEIEATCNAARFEVAIEGPLGRRPIAAVEAGEGARAALIDGRLTVDALRPGRFRLRLAYDDSIAGLADTMVAIVPLLQ